MDGFVDLVVSASVQSVVYYPAAVGCDGCCAVGRRVACFGSGSCWVTGLCCGFCCVQSFDPVDTGQSCIWCCSSFVGFTG